MITQSTCRALVPKTLDSQVLDLIRKINSPSAKLGVTSSRFETLKLILAVTKNSTIEIAVSTLKALDCYENSFYTNDKTGSQGNNWRVRDILNASWFPKLLGRRATDLKLWFWGGPPGHLAQYRGTLQTLVNDRVMYEIHFHGVSEVANLLGLG